ncbi:proteinase-activated receptor 4-like [Dunckerocampus dactyliophorus]|uniref:proteinase-activated receptor 4-like n=1 Tax=Dunckerocampus dactyliophorus TaxID=161453 RepID=UPI002406B4E8|nr:proteinase-activated receptor 4-like [Dunckerocampus dactyliophorus]
MKLFCTLVFIVLLSVFSLASSPRPTEECSGMSMRLRAFRLKVLCNVTTLKEKQLKDIQAPTTILYLPVLYLVALVVGLPSNLLALWILMFRTKRLPSTTLLTNLTAIDCLLLLALPFRIMYHYRGNHWELGEPFCRVIMAMFYGNMYGSVLCLALVALDRYIALVHPYGAKSLRSRRTAAYMTAAVWVVMLAAMLPLLTSQQTYTVDQLYITTCHDVLPQDEQENFFLPYFSTLFTLCFLLPFLVILFCHCSILRTLLAEGKRYAHAIWVTLLVLLVFIVCLLPSNVLLLLTYTDSSLDGDGGDLYMPYMLSLAVSTFSSCINPFIFYYVSADFRDKAKSALCCRGNSRPPTDLENKVSCSLSSSSPRSKVTLLSISSLHSAQHTHKRGVGSHVTRSTTAQDGIPQGYVLSPHEC